MSNAKLKYIGPGRAAELSTHKPQAPDNRKKMLKSLPMGFIVVVLVPTLIAALYFGLIASPRYVSEARFVVRSPGQSAPSALGMALQGVGLPSAQGDVFAVHEYVTSRDAITDMQGKVDVRKILGRQGVDMISRWPRPWEGQSTEALHKGLQRYLVVGYDSTTGISTLRVEAFSPRDAHQLAEALLQGGENLINRMNERSSLDSITHARDAQEKAKAHLDEANTELTSFRNRQRILDPELATRESAEVIGRLRGLVAELRAKRAEISGAAPQSPELSVIDRTIAGYESQIAEERVKMTGSPEALAPAIADYQELMMRQELASKEYAQASASLISAELDSARQKLYLDRVVSPNVPDYPILPKRLLSWLAVLASSLLVYGLGRLAWAGFREHHS